ncbi:IclR family transcriptional regulator [Nocardia otitidiscaviarum]|uniref:IclR family transcriptional regulator n=1 Tax=Nocardia otitidiscaviarum TaxID=1823 RepID=UPI0018953116|nr:IclR family transcriptional regulator [Nocardia otitidiscaviarum]MBF6241022.1 IclR family transcriptional regulator [Nocardia otitidiscaviarum]
MAVTAAGRSSTRSIDRVIQLLNCFDDIHPELSLSDLADLTGFPVSTAHRLAQTLVRGRMLEQDPGTGRYRIGRCLATLAQPALTRLGLDDAAPHLFELASAIRIAVSVSVADDGDAVTVFQARPPESFCVNQVPATRQPLASSAGGRAILAFGVERDGGGRRALDGPVLRERLGTDLDRVRRNGFAVADIEGEDPIRSIAVPIFGIDGRVRGALSTQARARRLDQDLVRAVVPSLRQMAVRVGPLLHAESAR